MRRLPASALDTVEEAVRAIVTHDDERLSVLAPDTGDLYHWTRDYGTHGTVDLVMPPGPAAEWDIEATDMADGGKHVAAGMWTKQEGRSVDVAPLSARCAVCDVRRAIEALEPHEG